jgi:hypothetical protein
MDVRFGSSRRALTGKPCTTVREALQPEGIANAELILERVQTAARSARGANEGGGWRCGRVPVVIFVGLPRS